jgi:hypothetical protein
MRFPTYPPDILSRADALLSEKYPDGIVDPRFVEIACEAMMAQREIDAKIAETYRKGTFNREEPDKTVFGWGRARGDIAKAIRGTK